MLKNKKHKSKKHSAGFSLIELLIAITIIVILGAVVGINLLDQPQKARQNSARMQLETFKTALYMYVSDNGIAPTQRQGLQALVEKPTTEPIPANYQPNGYLDARTLPKDPWGYDYVYLTPGRNGEHFEVICYGADGEEGGDKYNMDLTTAK